MVNPLVRSKRKPKERQKKKYKKAEGTILVPMLFVLFVDDLAQQMEQVGFHFLAYADDVAFLAAAEEVSQLEEQVARGLDIIEKWAEDLRLMLSREKTVVLVRKPDGSELSLDV